MSTHVQISVSVADFHYFVHISQMELLGLRIILCLTFQETTKPSSSAFELRNFWKWLKAILFSKQRSILKTSPSLHSFKYKPFSKYSGTFFASCFHHLELAISPKRNVGLFRPEDSNMIGGGQELKSEMKKSAGALKDHQAHNQCGTLQIPGVVLKQKKIPEGALSEVAIWLCLVGPLGERSCPPENGQRPLLCCVVCPAMAERLPSVICWVYHSQEGRAWVSLLVPKKKAPRRGRRPVLGLCWDQEGSLNPLFPSYWAGTKMVCWPATLSGK